MNFIFEIVYLLSDFVNLFKRIAIKVYALCIWGIEKDECKPTYAHHSTQPMQEHTVVCKIVHKFASVWCKTALGEVGVSLPWWCAALVLLPPGYWSLFLNLKNLFIMEIGQSWNSENSAILPCEIQSFNFDIVIFPL